MSVVVMAPWPTEDVGLLSDANYIQAGPPASANLAACSCAEALWTYTLLL